MSMSKPRPNYLVSIHDTTRQWTILEHLGVDADELFIYQTEDINGNPVLLYHTYDYTETDDGVDEVEFTRRQTNNQTSIPSVVYDDSWDKLLVEKFENAHGTVLACYPETEDRDKSNQGE